MKESSDFAFEVSVLRQLIALGFACEHAGTYEDPITKKTREYDIRARKCLIDESDFKLNISLSIECKNLKDYYPLLVHCMPRKENELYLDLIWASETEHHIGHSAHARRIRLKSNNTPYQKGAALGKSCDQIGRKATPAAEIIGGDGDVFEKISQAINAAYDLIKEAHYAAEKKLDVVTLVIPVLVVPNDRIWSVWYKETGDLESEPAKKNNIEYYLDKCWRVGDPSDELPRRYYLSYLEIVESQAISKMINKYTQLSAFTSRDALIDHKHAL